MTVPIAFDVILEGRSPEGSGAQHRRHYDAADPSLG
jgi:hypothetical protein